MKKLIFKSQILALASLLSVAVQAQAENYNLWVGGIQVTSENQENIIEEEEMEEPLVYFDPQTCTLTLNSVYVSCESGSVIESGLDSLVVYLIGYNDLYNDAIYEEIEEDEIPEGFIFNSTNPNANLIFTTNEKNPGQLSMYNYSQTYNLYNGFASVIYRNRLTDTMMDGIHVVKRRPDAPTVSPAGGVFADSVEVEINFRNIEGSDDYYFIAYQFNDDEEPTYVEDETALVTIKHSGTLKVWVNDYMDFASDTVSVEFRIVPSKVIDPIVGPEKGEDNDAPETNLTFNDKGFTDPDSGENIDLTNTVVDDILYTLTSEDGGYDKGDAIEGVPSGIVLATSLTEEEMATVQSLTPGTTEFALAFKGMTLLLPAGMGEFSVVANTEGGARLCVKIGDGEPVVISGTTYTDVTRIAYACPEDTYVYLYHGGTTEGARSTHRIIREKHETATVRVTGVGTHASSIITVEPVNTGGGSSVIKENVKMYEVTEGNFADNGHGIVIADVCGKAVTEISATIFAGIANKGDIDYIDLTGTALKNIEVHISFSRQAKGVSYAPMRSSEMPSLATLLDGFSLRTLLLLPAENDNEGRANVVIDGVCAELLLSDDAGFRTPKDFKAMQLTLQRDFTAGAPTTLVLPVTLSKEQTSAIGNLYTFDRIEDSYALFNETSIDCLQAHTPYLFIPAADAITVDGEMDVVSLATDLIQDDILFGTYKVMETMPADTYVPVTDTTDSANPFLVFNKADAASSLPAYSCYIALTGGPESIKAVIGSEVPVGIVEVADSMESQGTCYDLQGRIVKPVKKGLYIIDGKVSITK